jgi:hypothetical protein
MKRIYIPKRESKCSASLKTVLTAVMAFLFGCVVTASLVLNLKVTSLDPHQSHALINRASTPKLATHRKTELERAITLSLNNTGSDVTAGSPHGGLLHNTRILVVIVAFDFSQIPHLEEVLDGYHDIAVAGATVDVIVHATVPYPVTLLDLWNTRFPCLYRQCTSGDEDGNTGNFTITIVLKPKSLRLHLVDEHRTVFYEKIDDYDLFIYTEDDIRVTPTTVDTYLYETLKIQRIVEQNPKPAYAASDFNVGIVRYEYNYPPNVLMDDKTRHATQNVTRVYWEHSGFQRPVVPNAAMSVPQDILTVHGYITMTNHHQGMFMATRALLKAWSEREHCAFDRIRDRPGKGSQPTEGTQRVWMSSQMLYGRRHCNVQQVLPRNAFGSLTVLHLPNKNYRRVGKYRNRQFADGSEVFEAPHSSLLTAMEFHLGLQTGISAVKYPSSNQPYRGIRMIDEVVFSRDRSELLDRRMKEYHDYVQQGGIINDYDMTRTELVEEK